MAVTSSASDLRSPAASPQEKKSRSKCPGRIYDSDNGMTCHQCRQKTRDFAAQCKHNKDKPCSIKYCHKCLMNRYGEKAEEVALLDAWKCPKCRGICNCSFCRKKRGQQPTGILVRTAKENGFSSVSELLKVKGPENFSYKKIAKDVDPASPMELVVELPVKPGKENSINGKIDANLHKETTMEKESTKKKRKSLQELNKELKKPEVGGEVAKNEVKLKKKLKKNENNGAVDNVKSITESQNAPGQVTMMNGTSEGCEVAKNAVKLKNKIKKIENNGVPMENVKSITESQNAPGEVIMMNGTSEGCGVAKNAVKLKKKLKKNENNRVTMEIVQSITESQNAPGELNMMNETSKGCNVAEKEKIKSQISKDNVAKSNKVETNIKKWTKPCEINKCVTELRKIDEDIPLPLATSLVTIAGIELPNEVAGDALQFFEFCAAFGQALDIKKGQAEAVIREIVLGRRGRRLHGSLLVHFHIKLLSLILKDTGERFPSLSAENDQTSWLKALKKCVSNGNFMSIEFSSGSFEGNERYAMQNASQKFKLLNFLCDEALSTNNLRSWIDEQNLKFAESKKEAKEKVLAAKDKTKQLKQKVQDEVAKAIMAKNGATLSLSEHDEIISQIKKEAALAQAEVLKAMGMMEAKRVQKSAAVRTDPLFLDDNGRAFWRLKGYKDEPDILLQDMGTWDSVSMDEKWFFYKAEQKEGIEKYISSLRTKRLRVREAAAMSFAGRH